MLKLLGISSMLWFNTSRLVTADKAGRSQIRAEAARRQIKEVSHVKYSRRLAH